MVNVSRYRIRKAVPDDAERLTDVAHAAKRHWNYPARWMELWRDELTVSPRFVSTHPVYCALREGEVAGFYALSRRAAKFELEHLWVHPAHIGSGVGTRLFNHALARIREEGFREGRLRVKQRLAGRAQPVRVLSENGG